MGTPLRLLRYVVSQTGRTFAVTLVSVVGIFLVIDFADRARNYSGPNAAHDAAVLYLMKSVLMAYQLCPAAMLLSAGVCVSALRRRGEISAMGALTLSPSWLYAAVATAAAAVSVFAFGLDQTVLGPAGRRADELTAQRFRLWGDFSTWYGQRQWFRGHDRIYFLRGGDPGRFEDVSLFKVSDDFRLTSRIDAAAMAPQPGGSWELHDGAERTFEAEGNSGLDPFKSRELRLADPPSNFDILRGRPEQMPFSVLAHQVEVRQAVGLPVTNYLLALHNKLAYPLLGIPASLLAVALALRRGRAGHVTASILEGVAIVGVLWGTTLVFRAVAAAGHLSPEASAWAPLGLLCGALGVALVLVG